MGNFINAECPYCGRKFAEGDDIVVCPECGTPHHRECYKEHGSCANEERHGSFEWGFVPPKKGEPAASQSAAGEQNPAACPSCGVLNPAGARYCVGCGAPLGSFGPGGRSGGPTPEEAFREERERVFTQAFSGTNFEGVSPKEAAQVIRTNIEYFLFRFRPFASGRKADVNFSAFLFSYFYLFYRKMYGLGLAVFIANTVLSIPSLLLNIMTIQEMYVEQGLLSQIIWNVPHQEELMVFALIASVFTWFIRIGLMLFFNRLYYSKVINTVKKTRDGLEAGGAAIDEIAYYGTLRKKGGTSMIIPIILFALLMLGSFCIAGWIVTSPYFTLFQ